MIAALACPAHNPRANVTPPVEGLCPACPKHRLVRTGPPADDRHPGGWSCPCCQAVWLIRPPVGWQAFELGRLVASSVATATEAGKAFDLSRGTWASYVSRGGFPRPAYRPVGGSPLWTFWQLVPFAVIRGRADSR